MAGNGTNGTTGTTRMMNAGAAQPPWMKPWHRINDADKQAAIRLLAVGLSLRATAKRLGRTESWIADCAEQDPDFAAALNALASDRDDAAMQWRERVRAMASHMLDQIEELASAGSARDRNVAVRTFFEAVHNPTLVPRVPQAGSPTVVVSAEQAQLLFSAPAAVSVNDESASLTGVP